MDFNLNSEDLIEHLMSLRQPQQGEKKLSHPFLGDISFYTHQLPNIQAIELGMKIPGNKLIISDTHPSYEAINISFQLKGSMFTRFAGIDNPLDMQTGVHNLVYLSAENCGDKHEMHANQHIDVFQITIDKYYFTQCLGNANYWSENVINKIDKNIPFSASEKSLPLTPRMYQLIQNIQTDKKDGPMKNLLFQSRLFELLALQIEQFENMSYTEKKCLCYDDLQKLYALKLYLDTHFLTDLNLTQLSRVCCLNEFKLKKGFKQEFGETVFGYIRKLRMDYAQNLLQNTTSTIDEIASILGYEYAHHFTKAFKNFTGFTPSVYRHK